MGLRSLGFPRQGRGEGLKRGTSRSDLLVATAVRRMGQGEEGSLTVQLENYCDCSGSDICAGAMGIKRLRYGGNTNITGCLVSGGKRKREAEHSGYLCTR